MVQSCLERLAEKLPLEEPSAATDKAEAPANDALVRRKSGTRRLRTTYADKDPREIMKTLRQGNRNYIDKFDELLDGIEAQMEVCDHSPSPKHLAAEKLFLANGVVFGYESITCLAVCSAPFPPTLS